MSGTIPMNGEEPEIPESENSESQNLNSPISENLVITYPEITEKIKEDFELVASEAIFTIDDLIDVWARGMTNGATLWQYCQEQGYNLPVAFEAGALELVNEVRNSKDKSQALQAMLNNNMLLLGVFTEKQ